jgi:L-2,4-diaminobutyric acid acetyltransferase
MLEQVSITEPMSTDGLQVHQLIARCKPLDENSVYCNLLQSDHFSSTSAIAKAGTEVVGFVSGYRLPSRPDTFFVWQVAVDESQRGSGLATRMLQQLMSRDALLGASYLETTITKDNQSSWALFTRFAERLDAPLEKQPYYTADDHFNHQHETEWLVRIGPFTVNS